MNIVILSAEYPPYIYGGIGTFLENLSGGLVQQPGVSVTLYHYYEEDELRTETYNDIIVTRVPLKMKTKPTEFFRLIAKQSPDYDVIHIHNYEFFIGIVKMLQVHFPGRPVVYTSHSIIRRDLELSPEMIKNDTNVERNIRHKRLYKSQEELYELADGIVFPSKFEMGNFIADYPLLGNKTYHIPAGFVFKHNGSVLKRRGKHCNVLFIGRIIYRKGLGLLLDAIETMPTQGYTFIICGSKCYYEAYNQEIEKRIQTLLDKGYRIRNFGWLDAHKVNLLYEKVDMVIIPSTYEPFGYVVLEAVDHNLPVIYTKYGGCPDVAEYNLGEIIDPFNPRDIADKICTVHNNHTYYTDNITTYKKELHQKYDCRTIARQYLNYFEALIEKKKQTPGVSIPQTPAVRIFIGDDEKPYLEHAKSGAIIPVNKYLTQLLSRGTLAGEGVPDAVLDYTLQLKDTIFSMVNRDEKRKGPTVSAMVVVHNRQDYIKHCLDSILGQTYTDFEIVIYDDASDDETPLICREYQRNHNHNVFYFRNNTKVNVGEARQLALEKCRGKYIAICDSDDIFFNNRFALQVRALEEDHRIGLVCGNYIEINDAGIPNGKLRHMTSPQKVLDGDAAALANTLINPTAMLRKDAVIRCGGFNHYDLLEDFDLFLRMHLLYTIKYIDRVFTGYRIHDGNTSRIHEGKSSQIYESILESFNDLKEKEGIV